jgi:hypothetical protein
VLKRIREIVDKENSNINKAARFVESGAMYAITFLRKIDSLI